MSDTINQKHYSGVVAEWYDALIESEENDIKYYQKFAEESKGPVLELACGTGRLLFPYLKEGVQIDGVDVSEEMLEICKKKIDSMGLKSNLYMQDIADLDLPKQYQTIFIAGGSFQLISSFQRALRAMKKIYNHLLPGGKFIVDIFRPLDRDNIIQDGLWVKGREAQNHLGKKIIVYGSNKNNIDEQLIKGLYKYELYDNDRLTDTMIGEIYLRWYGKYEFEMMLEKAGFKNIKMEMNEIITVHGKAFVFTAEKE